MTQGVTLIFSYICRPGSFFGFKILNLNIFFYMKICGYFFFVSSQNWTKIRGHFYFLKVKVQNGGYFWGC